jgi:hypothetical protein
VKRKTVLALVLFAGGMGLVLANLNAVDAFVTRVVTGGSDAERWQADVRYLVRAMERKHPDLYHAVSREEFGRAARDLEARMPNMNDHERVIGVMRLVALAARERDGHAGVMFYERGFRIYPLRLYQFTDGVFVTHAAPDYAGVVGQRVVAIGGLKVEEALESLDPLMTRDNDTGVKRKAWVHLLVPEFMAHVGARGDEWTFSGTRLTVRPIEYARFSAVVPWSPRAAYEKDLGKPFWVEERADGLVFAKLNRVREEAVQGLVAELEGRGGRVVLDLRHNDGGDNGTYGPLLELLEQRECFVIIGRGTFSAAGNLVTEIEKRTKAVLVGEPTGSSPNQYGDAQVLRLPHSGVGVAIPTRYWVFAEPDDPRLAHEPQLWAELSSKDYFAGVDPAMRAILKACEPR